MNAIFLYFFFFCNRYIFAVPQRDQFGRRVIIVRPGKIFTDNWQWNKVIANNFEFAFSWCDEISFGNDYHFAGVFDPYKYVNTDMLKLHGMVYETLMEDEENHIRGYVHIVDCTGVNLPYMTLFTPKEAVRIVKNAEVNFNLFNQISIFEEEQRKRTRKIDFDKWIRFIFLYQNYLFIFKSCVIYFRQELFKKKKNDYQIYSEKITNDP